MRSPESAAASVLHMDKARKNESQNLRLAEQETPPEAPIILEVKGVNYMIGETINYTTAKGKEKEYIVVGKSADGGLQLQEPKDFTKENDRMFAISAKGMDRVRKIVELDSSDLEESAENASFNKMYESAKKIAIALKPETTIKQLGWLLKSWKRNVLDSNSLTDEQRTTFTDAYDQFSEVVKDYADEPNLKMNEIDWIPNAQPIRESSENPVLKEQPILPTEQFKEKVARSKARTQAERAAREAKTTEETKENNAQFSKEANEMADKLLREELRQIKSLHDQPILTNDEQTILTARIKDVLQEKLPDTVKDVLQQMLDVYEGRITDITPKEIELTEADIISVEDLPDTSSTPPILPFEQFKEKVARRKAETQALRDAEEAKKISVQISNEVSKEVPKEAKITAESLLNSITLGEDDKQFLLDKADLNQIIEKAQLSSNFAAGMKAAIQDRISYINSFVADHTPKGFIRKLWTGPDHTSKQLLEEARILKDLSKSEYEENTRKHLPDSGPDKSSQASTVSIRGENQRTSEPTK